MRYFYDDLVILSDSLGDKMRKEGRRERKNFIQNFDDEDHARQVACVRLYIIIKLIVSVKMMQ